MRKVVIVQSFDGHPIGAVVELSESAAESAVIQRRGVLVEAMAPAASPPTGPETGQDHEAVAGPPQKPTPAPAPKRAKTMKPRKRG